MPNPYRRKEFDRARLCVQGAGLGKRGRDMAEHEAVGWCRRLLDTDWQHPPVLEYATSPFFTFGNALTYEYTYFNSTNRTVLGGDDEEFDEVCQGIGWFFPAARPMICAGNIGPLRTKQSQQPTPQSEQVPAPVADGEDQKQGSESHLETDSDPCFCPLLPPSLPVPEGCEATRNPVLVSTLSVDPATDVQVGGAHRP